MDSATKMATFIVTARNVLFIAFAFCCSNFFCTGSPLLLYATHKDIRIANVSHINNDKIIVKNLSEGAVLDFYYERGLICWSDSSLKMIQCVHSNGTYTDEPTVIVNSSLISPDGLACDWYTGKLYWTDGEKKQIEVISIDDRHRKVLFWTETYQPRAIALAPMRGLLFWTDCGNSSKIERASMDGDPLSRTTIVSDDIFWPNSLTLDYDKALIYWVDGKLWFIEVMDYKGQNRRKIVSDDLNYPFAITLFDNRLYWTDWDAWRVHFVDIRQSQPHPRELFQGENISIFVKRDIEILDMRRQPYGENPCRRNNGNCSHLCLLSENPRGYSCACPTGVKLIDEYTCADRPEQLLLIVQHTMISKISLDSPDCTNFMLPLNGIKDAIAIDFDPVDEMLYWTDQEAFAIKRAYLNGSGQQDIIFTEMMNPQGIAIDWVARNLYWTDTGTDRIEVARLDGSYRRVLVNVDLDDPRGIAVAPEHGWMFWTDGNATPKIERSNLDGTERVILISKDIIWPNDIALDLERMKIYWCDAGTDKIEVANIDGTDRREVITDNLPYTFGLSLLDDFLYWTDWQLRRVERAYEVTGSDREVIIDNLPYTDLSPVGNFLERIPRIMGVKAVRLGRMNASNSPCVQYNGGCSHLCLNRPNNRYVCACQSGYELSDDNRTCNELAFLLFAKEETIGRISIENGTNDIIPVAGIKVASALDFDLSENRIYWTDSNLKAITRAFVNGSGTERIVDLGLKSPKSIAFDWIARNLYWSDTHTRRIEVIRLESGSRKVLLWQNLTEPRGLALDPERGYMYWVECDCSGSIQRNLLDGTKRQLVVPNSGCANGLAIDYAERKLYWADPGEPTIDRYDLVAQRREAVIKLSDLFYPFSVTQYRDYIYWTDWYMGDVERANKHSGGNITGIHHKLKSITDLKVFHPSRQTGTNPCAVANGNCSHLCIALPGPNGGSSVAHRCSCPTHYSLACDNRTCLAPRHFIIYSLSNTIARYLPDQADVMLGVPDLEDVCAIEFDPVTQHIYWIDGRTLSIRRALGNSTQQHATVVIPGGTGHPFDLALDPLDRLLFWTCIENDVVNAKRLDDSSVVNVVVKGDGEKPRNIAIDSQQRQLFWTDIGKRQVLRSRLSGWERYLIAEGLPEQPSSLAIDVTANVVYWAYGRQIDCSDFDGRNRKTLVVSATPQSPAMHLAVLFDYLFWYNRDEQALERTDKTSGSTSGERVALMPTSRALTDVIAVNVRGYLPTRTHLCPFYMILQWLLAPQQQHSRVTSNYAF